MVDDRKLTLIVRQMKTSMFLLFKFSIYFKTTQTPVQGFLFKFAEVTGHNGLALKAAYRLYEDKNDKEAMQRVVKVINRRARVVFIKCVLKHVLEYL